jgi:hypothetical protein
MYMYVGQNDQLCSQRPISSSVNGTINLYFRLKDYIEKYMYLTVFSVTRCGEAEFLPTSISFCRSKFSLSLPSNCVFYAPFGWHRFLGPVRFALQHSDVSPFHRNFAMTAFPVTLVVNSCGIKRDAVLLLACCSLNLLNIKC